jgi:filamentous hemagglutinin
MVREAMKDAPLQSQQQGGISLPRVQLFVDMLLRGEEPPAIKVDGKMIVDGNHRYIAARILGMNPKVQLWAGGRPANAVRWEQLPIDFKFW